MNSYFRYRWSPASLTPASVSSRLACKGSKYVYPAAGHVITGNLRIISDSRIRSIIAKGRKYRFPVQIDVQKCRKKLQDLLMNFVIVGVSERMLSVML